MAEHPINSTPPEEMPAELNALFSDPKAAKRAKKAKKAEAKALRLQKKAEKKAAKARKKEEKRNRFVLYDPQKMQGFTLSLPIGYFLRFFAIGFSLFGVLWLFCDAFALTEVSALPLLAYCVFAVAAFSMIFIGKWFTLAGLSLLGVWVGLFFWLAGNPLTFFVSGIEAVFDAMMYRLSEAGFAASASISLPYFGGLSDAFGKSEAELLIVGGVYALATLFGLIFAAFSAKRTRLLPMIVLGGGLCAVCFTYNLCETNWGIACVLAGLCSAAVLSAYDKLYKEHKQSKKSRAYSGYSAALAGLLALAIAAAPAAGMTERWSEIGFIARPIKEARTFITTILTGGNPAYNKMNTLIERRSNKLEDIEFKNVVLFNVSLPAKHSVYLRSWIGGDYDYQSDEWMALSSTQYSQMLKELDGEGSHFMGDKVTFDLYSLLSSKLADGTFQEDGYLSSRNFGYTAAFVDIEYVNNSGQLFVLPSAYASPIGLQEYGKLSAHYSESAAIEADGMLTSGWFNLTKSYTAPAVLPSYYAADYGSRAAQMAEYYRLLVETIDDLQRNPLTDAEKAVSAFAAKLGNAGIRNFPTQALEDYLALSRNERAIWYARYVRTVHQYGEYVQKTYSAYPTDSEGIAYVLEQIGPALQKAENDHEKVMAVVDYLTEHYTYTYTPTKPEDPDGSNLDAFLLETKDGYCVQFASAAALILRAAGLPARYVQGYVADDLTIDSKSTNGIRYNGTVRDTAAHAWVEVYMDGLGWRTYETTPVYYENLYYVESSVTDPGDQTTSVTRPPVTTSPPITTRPDPTTPAGQTTADPEAPTQAGVIDPMQIVRIVVLLVAIGLIALVILWRIRRARKVIDGRDYYIERSIYGVFEEKPDFDRVAGVLCDSIMEVHGILGDRPLQGELPGEFAARISAPPPADAPARLQRRYGRSALLPSSFVEIMGLIQKQEFGRALTRAELETLGVYLRALIDSEYPALPLHRRLWYRYIRFMI